MDFGIAKAVTGTKLSATGTLIGTFPYMAPEQWLGEPAAFSNDIWAVGCVLYELLSGRLARSYPTPTEYVAAAARRERVAPLPGGVPAWLADAVTIILQPNLGQRPTGAQCVQLLTGLAAYSPPASSPTQVPQSTSPRQSPVPQQPVPARQPAPSTSARQAPVSPETASSTRGAFPGGRRQPPVSAAPRTVTFSPPTTTVGRPSRRRFLIAAGGLTGLAAIGATTAWKLLGTASQRLPGPLSRLPMNTSVNSVAFSPDGRTLASGNGPGTIQLWNVTDPAHPVALGNPLTAAPAEVVSVALSPDGHSLVSAGGDLSSSAIQLWNITDLAHPAALGEPLTGPATPFNSVAFSPNGHTLASGSGAPTFTAGAIQLWNVTDLTHPTTLGKPLNDYDGAVAAVAFSPDGRILAGGNGNGPLPAEISKNAKDSQDQNLRSRNKQQDQTGQQVSCFRVMRRGCRRSRRSRVFVRVGSDQAVWQEIVR
jgi:hypothetical protein